tara:strand:- start:1816 stop:2901 length:1086 start_codon:yes stop_codon:yes gene_type:complete
MDISVFKTVAKNLPPHVAVLMRGPTGIGKSQVTKTIADELALPFIDVRGSTMQEGDVIGYPDLEAMKRDGVSTFCLPSWFVRATKEPCVLMLDELNRSMPGVMQGFFQIVLDRELGNDSEGNPICLHPETRVFAAVNVGNEYDVNDMDPALLRRFWVADLEPDVKGWMDWARAADLDATLIEFIGQNPEHWRVDAAEVEPGSVCPNPASWHRLADSLEHCGWSPSILAGNSLPAGFYPMLTGFIGTEAAIAFADFVKNYEKNVTAEDIIDGKVTAEELKEAPASLTTAVIDKLELHSKDNKWTAKQVKNVAKFAEDMGGELMLQTFTAVQKSNNIDNLVRLNKIIGKLVVEIVNGARSISK